MDMTPHVSEESVQRCVTHASDGCQQDLLSASRPELSDDWKLYKIKRVVEISRRYEGPVMVVGGRSFINLRDPYFVDGQHPQNVEDNLDLLRLVFSSGAGPLFWNREFIVYERRETMDDGTQARCAQVMVLW